MESFQELWSSIQWDLLWSLLLRLAAVFLCLTVHETCHGLAAYALGDPTAKRMNRLSLNPLHHIDWFGLASMMIVGFGWAKPVPVDMRYFKNPKWGMALCALAGPVSNFLLAALCMPLAYLALDGAMGGIGVLYSLFQFLMLTALMSLGLGVFNLIPIPPLDGSKVLFAFLPDRLYAKLMHYERYGMLLLFALIALGALNGVIDVLYGAVLRLFFTLFGMM